MAAIERLTRPTPAPGSGSRPPTPSGSTAVGRDQARPSSAACGCAPSPLSCRCEREALVSIAGRSQKFGCLIRPSLRDLEVRNEHVSRDRAPDQPRSSHARAVAIRGAQAPGPASVLVGPDQASLLDHVILDPREKCAAIESGLEVELIVERIEPEVVVVSAVAGRWRRSVVAVVPERVLAGGCFGAALGQAARIACDVVRDPVREAVDERRVRIVDDNGKRLGALRDACPVERRRAVIAVARMPFGYALVVAERGRAQLQVLYVQLLRHRSSLWSALFRKSPALRGPRVDSPDDLAATSAVGATAHAQAGARPRRPGAGRQPERASRGSASRPAAPRRNRRRRRSPAPSPTRRVAVRSS